MLDRLQPRVGQDLRQAAGCSIGKRPSSSVQANSTEAAMVVATAEDPAVAREEVRQVLHNLLDGLLR